MRRAILAVLMSVMIMAAVPMVVSAAGTVIDDFNDGNLDGWTTDSTHNATTYAKEGSHALKFTKTGVTNEHHALSPSFSDGTTNSTLVYIQLNGTSNAEDFRLEYQVGSAEGSTVVARLTAENGGLNITDPSEGDEVNLATYPTGEWLKVNVEFDYDNDQLDIDVFNESGDRIGSTDNFGFANTASDIDSIDIISQSASRSYNQHIDFVATNGAKIGNDVSGYVLTEDGNGIDGATVTLNDTDGSSTTTDSTGFYEFTEVANGTYKLNASKDPDFINNSTTVTVSGADVENANITLAADKGLTLDVKAFIEHNGTVGYTVLFGTDDVTDSATVTSSNTTVVVVNTTSNELEATGNNKINQEVTITAKYQGLEATQNVTVANKSLNNIGILPPSTWPAALLGSGGPGDTTGASSTWPGAIQLQWIFVALGIGATLSYVTGNSFISNAAILGVLAMGMFYGWVSNGLLIMSIVFVLYITSTRGMGGINPNIGSKRG